MFSRARIHNIQPPYVPARYTHAHAYRQYIIYRYSTCLPACFAPGLTALLGGSTHSRAQSRSRVSCQNILGKLRGIKHTLRYPLRLHYNWGSGRPIILDAESHFRRHFRAQPPPNSQRDNSHRLTVIILLNIRASDVPAQTTRDEDRATASGDHRRGGRQ